MQTLTIPTKFDHSGCGSDTDSDMAIDTKGQNKVHNPEAESKQHVKLHVASAWESERLAQPTIQIDTVATPP